MMLLKVTRSIAAPLTVRSWTPSAVAISFCRAWTRSPDTESSSFTHTMPGTPARGPEPTLEDSTNAGTWRVRRTLASRVTWPPAVDNLAGPSGESSGR
ncbi:hypothetical protein PJL18_04333 [Paenarthrobacter nicotinovorans]|nr:hypothetical protein [Paenarthrobacter nicotinovorans]